MTAIGRLRRLAACRSGVAAVEFALVGLFVISLVLGVFEFGRAFYVHNQLTYAADVATRKVLLNPPGNAQDLQRLEADIRATLTGDRTDLTIEMALPSSTRIMPITFRENLRLMVPGLSGTTIPVTVRRQIPVAGFR